MEHEFLLLLIHFIEVGKRKLKLFTTYNYYKSLLTLHLYLLHLYDFIGVFKQQAYNVYIKLI